MKDLEDENGPVVFRSKGKTFPSNETAHTKTLR